jgi:xylan 1,4-beta-xylosidase
MLPQLFAADDWRAAANARIEKNREQDFQIQALDAQGRPASGAQVECRQVRPAFPFGAAMSSKVLDNPQYQEFFRTNFNWAVFNNESKWYANEPARGKTSYAAADAMLDWCAANDIPVRGHNLFWSPEKWQPQWIAQLGTNDLRNAVESRLEGATAHFRGRFLQWDVNNEMLHGSFFRDRLGEAIEPWMFQSAHELDPAAKLFVNDYNILSVDQSFNDTQTDEYVAEIRKLLAQGAPIDGVGIQGHIWNENILAHPEVIKQRLDKIAALGLPIWITEFDVADAGENSSADKLELVYRTAYSHPAVAGIMTWIPWAGDSWRGTNAGLARVDWTLSAAGQRFESLMREWSTHTNGQADAQGIFNFRGFPGDYEITVSISDGKSVTRKIAFDTTVGKTNFIFNLGQTNHSTSRVIAADLAGKSEPLNRMYQVCVGAGRANEGLRGDWQRQLKLCHDELGFGFIRFHGLFTDDMGVYSEDAQGNAHYNWQNVDALYDQILATGMRPFVELSFMPSTLASGKKTVFWWRGNVTPPKSLDRWAEFMHAFAEHLTERYGADEVERWRFEVWNEPNLAIFWTGTQPDYFQLYERTARAIKSVNPNYQVGGPATAGGGWIGETINFCASNGVPIDFISTHAYNVAGAVDEFGTSGQALGANLHGVADDIARARNTISHSALTNLALHFTEWSSSYSSRDPVHDDYISAPFILEQIKRAGRQADSMSYWVFTDIFEESGVPTKPFHGGFGLLTVQGIRKPAYFAYRYLDELGGREIATTDDRAFVCHDENGGVQVLFWDLTHPSPDKKFLDQTIFARARPAPPKGSVTVKLAGLKPGNYSLRVRGTGYQRNDACTQYLEWGAPDQLTRQQENALAALAADAPLLRETVTVAGDGKFSRNFDLRENDVYFVTLTPEP